MIIAPQEVEWDKTCRVNIEEFPMYETRLQEIDWVEHVINRTQFNDPFFPADINSILDSSLPCTPRHVKWKKFVWKRPIDIYGPNNFVIYDSPGPTDIV